MNIKSIIEETITEFSAGNSVADKLSKINANGEALTEWVYSTNSFEDYILTIIHRETVFESIKEIDETDTKISDKSSDELWANFVHLTEDEFCISLHVEQTEGVTLHCLGESWGQGGIHFSNFGLAKSREIIIQEYIESGFFISDGEVFYPEKKVIIEQIKSNIKSVLAKEE